MDTIAEIVRDLLIFIVVMFAMLIVLILVVSRLPDGNPLKRILTALSYRVGATLGAGIVAVPVEPIPGLDVIYDVGVPLALIYFWYTFFRDAFFHDTGATMQQGPKPPSGMRPHIIDHER